MKQSIFVCLWLILSQLATAETTILESGNTKPKLVELFTSEGCSSCPPADEWISKLKYHDGLWTNYVPVVFHVDYWDWIGWKDRFASSEYSKRQRQYKKDNKVSSVYTPGFVVAGEEWRGFFSRQALPSHSQPSPGKLSIKVVDDEFKLDYHGDSDAIGRAHVVLLGMNLATHVKRGENEGRLLVHDFVALDWQSLPQGKSSWKGRLAKNKNAQTDQYAIAAWVEQADDVVPYQVIGGYLN